MKRTLITKKIKTFCLAGLLILASALPALGASRTACGDGGGSWNFTETPTQTASTGPETVSAVSMGPGQTVYTFDGKRYVIDSDWGVHNLTGFCPNADGSRTTRSGAEATAGYTVSSTYANLGKVILIQAESGPASGDIHRYDGLYKCEDTGGVAVEYGNANTGHTPVVDIFFDTEAEALKVSSTGWIKARIYILREVD